MISTLGDIVWAFIAKETNACVLNFFIMLYFIISYKISSFWEENDDIIKSNDVTSNVITSKGT